MINNYYATPKIHIPKPRILNEDTAKAKGLIRYNFGEDNFLYAKDDREAIKRRFLTLKSLSILSRERTLNV